MAFSENIEEVGNRFWKLAESVWLRPVSDLQYALQRSFFSFVALLAWLELWPYRYAFFSSEGMVSQVVAISETEYFYPSVFGVIQSGSLVTAYFVFSAVAIVCLGMGWKPRLAAFFVFLWFMSFTFRAPIVTTGWDLVLRCFSFLILVSPLGESWKLPFKKGKSIGKMVPVYGLVLMRLQVVVIYWQAIAGRIGDPWWGNGDFFAYFLLSYHSRWPGIWVIEHLTLIHLITWITLLVELVIPVFLMISKTRWIGIWLGVFLHLSIILLTQDITLFSLTMIMTYTAFLRKPDIDWIQSKLPTKPV